MPSYIRAKRSAKFNRALSTAVVSMLAGGSPMGVVSMLANPAGEQVVSGDATFVREGNTLTITQTSQHAIINWQDFSISSGNITQFLQNNANAAALNRVVSLNPSLIEGTLQATGRVILINPNGITVSSSGVIDTGSFIGSTLDVSNEQFLDGGALDFVGESASSITNLGEITGDKGVFLFARRVDNAGAIVAPGGQVGLASGSHILLQPTGDDDRVSVLVGTTSDLTLDGEAIRNTGEVHAALVTLNATGSAYATAVNNEGIIRAQGFDTTGGRVLLTGGSTGTVLSSGTITAKDSDGTGGYVAVTGDRVGLTGNAVVDVSGENGGGTALIGGSFQGKADTSVQNASRTYVGSDVQIKADATTSGDGGTVIVWADEVTRFFGDVSAQGGALSGNGGFIEVSGKQNLLFAGTANTTAAHGATGTLLLDPDDIVIQDQSVSPSADDIEVLADGVVNFADGVGTFNINELVLESLAANTNIVLQANNTITVDALVTDGAITLANNNNITLQTTNGAITFTDTDDQIVTTGTGFISILSGTDATLGGLTTAGGNITVTTVDGDITTSATRAINAGVGVVALTAGSAPAADSLLTVNAGGITGTGGVTLVADNMAIGGAINSGANLTTLRQFEAGTTINVGGADAAGVLGLSDAELDFITSTAAGAIQIGDANSGNLTVTAAITPAFSANLRLTTGGAISVEDDVSVTGNLRLQSATGTTQTAAGELSATGLSTAGAGAVNLTAATNNVDVFASASTANVTFANDDALSIGVVGGISGVNLSGNAFTLTTAGALTQANNIQVGDFSATTTTGGITLNAANNAITGAITVSTPAAQAVSITNAAATNLGAISLTGGSFTLVSTGAITQSGALALGTTATTLRTINNAGAAITLGDAGNAFGNLTAETRNLANDGNVDADIALADSTGFVLEDIRTLGDVALLSGGLVTQTATSDLIIGGNLSIDTTAFGGAGDVNFRSDAATGTQFEGDTIVQGDLTVTNTVGGTNITQAGGSSVSVAGTFNANPGVGGTVTLSEPDNIITTLNSGDGSVIIRNVGDIDLDGTLIAGPVTGNLSVTALDEGDVFAGAPVTGTDAILLDIGGSNNQIGTVTFVTQNSGFVTDNAGTNNITQSVDLVVTGTSSFVSGGNTAGDITLDRVGNNFTGAVSASGDNIALVDSNGIILGQTVAAGSYAVTAGGAITQQAATLLDVAGVSSFSNSGANAITLNQANLLDGAISVTQSGAGAVSLNNNQATVLGAISTQGGNLTVTSNGNLTQSGGVITQTVGGSLNLNVTGDATLDAANQLLAVGNVSSSGDVLIAETDGFNLTGTANVTGALALDTTAGGVNQTGGSITADELLLLGAGTYSLAQAPNNVATFAANVTGDVTLVDSNGLAIGSVNGTDGVATDGGNLSITAATGNITVGQTVTPGAGDVSLQATAGQLIQSGVTQIAMGGGALSLNAAAGGAVGSSINPILTSGSYSLASAPTLAGGVFVTNQSVAGDITVTSLAPANGAIALTNSIGSITLSSPVASGVLGNVVIDASDDLLVNAAVNGTTIELVSGDELVLGANVGTGTTTTVVLDNTGALSRTGGTVTAATSLTLEGAGDVGSGSVADTLVTDTALVIFNKPSGDVFLRDTVGALGLQGSLNGALVVRSANDLFVPVGQSLTNASAVDLTALSAGGSINVPANSGNVALNGGGLWLFAGTSIGTSPVDLMDFSNAGILTARAAGPIFLNNTAGDLSIGNIDASAFSGVDASFANQSGLLTTVAGQGIRLNSAAGTILTVNNAVQTTNGDIALVVASPGGVPNGLIVDAVVQSNFVGGGNYVIGGGTVINVNPIAGAGTTITLDGGGQDINIATDQSYAGSVTFNAPGDILISAALATTGANANLTLTADSDLNGTGGVRIFDDAFTGSASATGLITVTGSDLVQSAGVAFDAIVLDAGATRVSSTGAVQAIILQTTASALDERNILIGGNVVSSSTGTTLIQSFGSADSFIEVAGQISASQIAATNTITINTPGELRLDGTISTASTNNNAITIANAGAIVIDGGVLTATNSGGVSLAGTGNVGTGVGGDILFTENIGRFTFNKALTDAFVVQQLGDATVQGTIGGLVLVTQAGGIGNSAALTAGRVTLDAAGNINLTSSNSIGRFVNAPGATGMGANVAANAVTTFGDFSYLASAGSNLTLGDVAATAPFGTDGIIAVSGIVSFNLLAAGTNFTQLENSEIFGSAISIQTSGTASFASNVGDFGTTSILLNNTGAATFDAVTNPVFTATGTLTLQGNGAVGTLADTLLTDVTRLTLNKNNALPGVGDVFVEQIATTGGLQLDGTSGASVSVNMLGVGQDITQVAALNIGPGGSGGAASAGPDVANNTDATLSLATTGGSVTLTNTGNKVRNFGTIDVVDGAFTYVGATAAAAVETRFTDSVNVTGIGAGLTVTFGGNVANRQDLVIENGVQFFVEGNVQFIRNAVGSAGSVYLGGDITTANDGNILFQTGTLGDANFTPVILTDDVTLATNSVTPGSGNVAFDGTVSNLTGLAPRFDLTINAGEGNVNFQRLVGGAAGALRIGDLLVNSQGNTTFTNQVFAENVTTDAGGITFLVFANGGGFAVDTTNDQIYGDSVRLSANIDLRSDGDVIFDGTVDSSTALGARNLYVEAAGDTAFNDDVGVTNFLETVTTDAPGSVTINGNDIADGITLRTRGTQTYNATAGIVVGGGTTDANVLTTNVSDSTADLVAGDIILNGGLDGLNAGVNDLLLIAGDSANVSVTGDIQFAGAGGSVNELGDIVIRVADNVTISAGGVESTTFLQEQGFGTTTIGGDITASSATTPAYALAPIVAGGGVQIHANSIIVNADITAENDSRVLLNSGTDLLVVGTTIETTGDGTTVGVAFDKAVHNRIDLLAADDVLVGTAAQAGATTVQTLNGAINIEAANALTFAGGDNADAVVITGNAAFATLISANGDDNGTVTITADAGIAADHASIRVNSATIQAGGGIDDTVEPAISLYAANDIILGDSDADADTILTTNDGAIHLVADNERSADSDGTSGIKIRGSDIADADVLVNAGGANGSIYIASSVADAADTLTNVQIYGGDFNGASAAVNAEQELTIEKINGLAVGYDDGIIDFGAVGNFGDNATASLTSGSTMDISVNDIVLVQGGDGDFASALIGSNGAQTITVLDGVLIVQGGAGEESTSTIGATLDQEITVLDGDIFVGGGRGIASGAAIFGAGLVQTITAANGNLTVQGNQTATDTIGATTTILIPIAAGIAATNLEAVQTISVTNGDLLVQGGAEEQEVATIANIGGEGRQIITVTNGDLNIFAGAGADVGADSTDGVAAAAIVNAGLNTLAFDPLTGVGAAQLVTVTGGDLNITGGANVNAQGNLAGIANINEGESTQYVDVSGVITLTGGEGELAAAGIIALGFDNTVASGISQHVIAGSGLDLNGGSGQGAVAGIGSAGILGEQIIQVTENDLTMNGGTGDSAAAVIVSTYTQDVTVTDGDLLIEGGDGISAAAVMIAQNAQTVTVTSGNLTIRGGLGQSAGAGIQMENVDADLAQTVTVTDGDVLIEGGAGLNSRAGIAASLSNDTNATQSLIVSNGTLTINGGDGEAAEAGVEHGGSGQQLVEVSSGIAITGGAGLTAQAGIEATRNGNQVVTVTGLGNLTLAGGEGEDADALILQGADGNQTITVTQGNLLVQADQSATANSNSDGYIESAAIGGTQTINVSGSITVLGGNNGDAAATNETAYVLGNGDQFVTAGSGLTVQGGDQADNIAFIEKAGEATDRQLIVVNTGLLQVLGSSGTNADASIVSNGSNGVALGEEAQRIIVADGNLVIDAGDAANGNSTAFIESTNTGAATQFIDVEGSISVLGGDGGGESAFIRAAGFAATNGLAQDINATNAVTVQSGALGGGNTFIESTGAFGRQRIVVQSGDLRILAGAGGGNSTFIRAAGDNGALPGEEAQRIIVADGNLLVDADSVVNGGNQAFIELTNTTTATQLIDVEGTLEVLGGNGGETAFIRAAGFNAVNGLAQDINSLNALTLQSGQIGGSNAFIESTGAFGRQQVVVQNGDLSILAGTGGGNSTFIRSAGDNGALPGEESQRIIVADGDLILDANSGAGGNQAFIALTNATTATQVVDVEGSISVLGGDGGGESASISSAGFGASLGLAQDINALSGMLLEGGNANGGGNAFVQSTGAFGRQSVVVQTGDLRLLGGAGSGNSVRITSAGLNEAVGEEAQRIIVSGGNLLLDSGAAAFSGATTAITASNTGAATQIIDVEGTISVLAGDGGGENATISAAGFAAAPGLAQDINALSGLLIEGGGANFNNNARILATGAQGEQRITVQNNDLTLLGGNGGTSSAGIESAGLLQNIDVLNGNLAVTANQDAVNTASGAAIIATNTDVVQTVGVAGAAAGEITISGGAGIGETAILQSFGTQTITAANGISVTGGTGAGSTAGIQKTGDTAVAQTITVQNGDFSIVGGAGASATALVSSNGSGTLAGSEGQRILVLNGDLLVEANATVGAGSATIESITAGQTQFIQVDGTAPADGNITIRGGGAGTVASITSAGVQNISADNTIAIEANVANSLVQITATGDQNIESENANMDVDANGADAVVTISTDAAQSIVLATNLTIDASNNADVDVLAVTTQEIDATAGSIAISADAAAVTIQNTAGAQDITAGTNITVEALAASTVLVQADSGLQTITANGLIDLSANASLITVNSETAAQAITATTGTITIDADNASNILVTANTTQDITAGTNITVEALAASTVLVQADAGLQTITANGLIDLSANDSDITVNSETAAQAITATTGTITFDADNASNILVTANTTQDITATAGDLIVDANASTIEVLADTGTQTILANGDIDVTALGSTITIDATANAQDIIATTGDITIDASATSAVEVTAAAAQAIDATAGMIAITANASNVTVQNTLGTQDITAGTNITVEALAASTVLVQADAGLQTITANGLIDLSANDSDITVNSETAAQAITATTGTVTIDADNASNILVTANTTQDITATAGDIIVDALNSTIEVLADTGAQTILANGLIDVNASNSTITIDATANTQAITATTGTITIDALAASTVELFAATAQTITAGTGIDIGAEAVSTVDVFAGTTQDITATTGNIAITTADAGTQVNILALSNQNIDVADAAGDLSITATTGSDVLIGTLAIQTITVGNDLLVTASDANTSVEIGSGTSQDIDVGNDLTLDASSAAGIAILGGTDQTITAAQDISIDALTGSSVEVLAATTQDIEATAGTIAITANASNVTVQNTLGAQDITAGTNITVDAAALSTVLVQADDGLQTITANGLIDLGADNSDITVNSETDAQDITATNGTIILEADNAADVLVTASTTQEITATTSGIIIDAQNANIDVLADLGAQTILANGSLAVNAVNSTITLDAATSTQAITATTGDITIDAVAASTVLVTSAAEQTIGATAGSISLGADGSILTVQNNAGAQTITAGADIAVEALAGATLLVQADAGLQTVTAGGLIDIDSADGALLTINSDANAQAITATAGAITINALDAGQVLIFADGDQDIEATAAGIALSAADATLRIQTANGDQSLIAGSSLTAVSSTGSLLQVQADTRDQTVDVGGLIDLAADDASVILAAVAGSQTVTSDGVTNLTGINGGSTLVTAIDSTLNNAGGVLTGNAVIGTSGVTELVTINNSGALTLADVDAAHVHVNADAGAATVTFQGAGTVGAIADGERLVTNTAILDFAAATKTVILDERVGDVGIEGVVGNLDIVLTDALGGNITDSADFTALIATLETTDGDITLGANTVVVDEFSGLVANNGSIDVSLDGNTILGNRADGSLDAGVFADGDITVVTTGSTTITADLVLSTAGDIAFTATSLVLDAENAAPNTQLNGLSGPTGAVGVIQTNDGIQTYDAPVVLLANTRISATDAGNGSDAVVFNGTINGPGGLEIGSTPVFNAFIGDTTPLAYLILNSDSVFNAASGDPALGSASVNLAGSFINNGTMTLGNPLGGVNENFTFIVDSGLDGLGGSVFQGGLLNNHISQDAVNGSFITVFGADLNSVSFDNIPLGTQQFGFYTFNPGFAYNDPLAVFTPGFIYYKAEQVVDFENLRERLEREDTEKETTVAYDGSVVPEGIAQLAGSEPTSAGSAGGVATSTYDIVQPGEVQTVRQVVFGNVVVLP